MPSGTTTHLLGALRMSARPEPRSVLSRPCSTCAAHLVVVKVMMMMIMIMTKIIMMNMIIEMNPIYKLPMQATDLICLNRN